MKQKDINNDLNLIVSAFVRLTQLSNQMAEARQDWEYAQLLLKNLNDSQVVPLSDSDLHNARLVSLELRQVQKIVQELMGNYMPGEYLKRMQK